MPAPLDKLSRELRAAILAGDHALANRIAPKYAEAVREFWDTVPASDRAGSTVPRVARELLTWARGMTIVQRAIAADELGVVQRTKRYNQERLERVRTSSIQVRV